jgi:hypothetical protein
MQTHITAIVIFIVLWGIAAVAAYGTVATLQYFNAKADMASDNASAAFTQIGGLFLAFIPASIAFAFLHFSAKRVCKAVGAHMEKMEIDVGMRNE